MILRCLSISCRVDSSKAAHEAEISHAFDLGRVSI